jgi:hypothetical protein
MYAYGLLLNTMVIGILVIGAVGALAVVKRYLEN